MTVFVVQDQKWIDPTDGQLKSKFDFTSALQFGELEYLLEPRTTPYNLEVPLGLMHNKLATYNPTLDYLLLVGNPVLIGLAVAVAADAGEGDVSLLQWSGAKRCYIPIQASGIFP